MFDELQLDSVSTKAKIFLLTLLGFHKLGLKLPTKLPYTFADAVTVNLFDELKAAHILIGNYKSYHINFKKLKMTVIEQRTIEEDEGKPAPTVKDLIDKFKKLHRRIKKLPAKRSSREIQQIRFLVRKFGAKKVATYMPLFFVDENVKKQEWSLTVDYFFKWAKKKIK